MGNSMLPLVICLLMISVGLADANYFGSRTKRVGAAVSWMPRALIFASQIIRFCASTIFFKVQEQINVVIQISYIFIVSRASSQSYLAYIELNQGRARSLYLVSILVQIQHYITQGILNKFLVTLFLPLFYIASQLTLFYSPFSLYIYSYSICFFSIRLPQSTILYCTSSFQRYPIS